MMRTRDSENQLFYELMFCSIYAKPLEWGPHTTCIRTALDFLTRTFVLLCISPVIRIVSPVKYPFLSSLQYAEMCPTTKHKQECGRYCSLAIGIWEGDKNWWERTKTSMPFQKPWQGAFPSVDHNEFQWLQDVLSCFVRQTKQKAEEQTKALIAFPCSWDIGKAAASPCRKKWKFSILTYESLWHCVEVDDTPDDEFFAGRRFGLPWWHERRLRVVNDAAVLPRERRRHVVRQLDAKRVDVTAAPHHEVGTAVVWRNEELHCKENLEASWRNTSSESDSPATASKIFIFWERSSSSALQLTSGWRLQKRMTLTQSTSFADGHFFSPFHKKRFRPHVCVQEG